MNDIIKVFVVDDHALFRMGISMLFHQLHREIRYVGEAGDGETFFTLLPATAVDVVLLDINLPGMSGAEIARRLRSESPGVKILAISGENTAQAIEAMLEAGIDGFVSKQKGNADELIEAIRSVMNGVEYFGRDIARIMFDVYVSKKKTTAVTNEFTEREREIILLCRDGLLSKEIADRLGISFNTVNAHKKRIFQKLGINTTVEMVMYALNKGIIW
jgi:DNA-binding NarL/FixJ family response regulator